MTEIEQLALGTSVPSNVYFTAVDFSGTFGPYRLGVTLGASSVPFVVGAATNQTEFLSEAFSWYEDENTEYDETVAGVNHVFIAAASPTALAGDVARLHLLGFGLIDAPEAVAKFTGVEIDGDPLEVDGMELSDASLEEVGAGAFNMLSTGGSGVTITAAPGGSITYDPVIVDFAGTAVGAAQVTDNWVGSVDLHDGVQKTPFAATLPLTPTLYTAPFQTNYSRPTRNLPGVGPGHEFKLSMVAAWMTAQGWDPLDLPVILDQPSPLSGAASYSPLALFHKGAIEVDIPDGGRPSSWSINSGANGSVTENAGDTVFVVSNVAAVFTRTFAENWRNQITPGHADFTVEGYATLKHNYRSGQGESQAVNPEDVWWWNSYEFLHLNITASGNATLTLQVDGIDLEVEDTHNPNPVPRAFDLLFTHHAERRIYTVDVTTGTADYWIDLSFPASYVSPSGAYLPMRRPRVDTLTLTSSATGTFTLNAMELSRRDSYANQIQVANSGVSTYPGEWPHLLVRVDGTGTAYLTVPDDFQKGQERDVNVGGALRFAAPSTSLQKTAEAVAVKLSQVEGFSYTYSDAAHDAFHEDAVGAQIVTRAEEPAQFLLEQSPGTNWSGAGDAHTTVPAMALRVGSVSIPNGMTVTAKGRKRLGGAVEGMACVAGERGGAGLDFDLLDADNNVLASVTSDTRGRIAFAPVKHDLLVRFEEG